MSEEKKEIKHAGRPKNVDPGDTVVNETENDRLDMSNKKQSSSNENYITVEQLDKRWSDICQKFATSLDQRSGEFKTVVNKWNQLNPFLQNQRIKNLYTQAKEYSKEDIGEFLKNPGGHETELRALAWSNSAGQQIYYNILRRAADVPTYYHYLIPDDFLNDSDYSKEDFKIEDKFINRWVEKFDIPNTFKTIALEVKREGKSSYLLRNQFLGEGKNRQPGYCTLQKLPTDWIKITGKSELGFTISFNMMYFANIANSPSNYGDFMMKAWEDLKTSGVFTYKEGEGKYEFNVDSAQNYKFSYNGQEYSSFIEAMAERGSSPRKKLISYLFWLKMPYDICYTFGSDNSNPWVTPDTIGLLQNLQELSDYGQLAGLIASTPLSAVLTGEIEPVSQNQRAGMNETVFSPEVIQGMMDRFNAATSTNIEAWMWPAKNIKLHQLESDVNASEIISTSTENFIQKAGESGLTITTEKPNIGQITVAKLLSASQQNYVTLQFKKVMNFILQHKLGLKYYWKIDIWGDIFNSESEKKYLKEVVASGNIALLPKLMSAEGLSMKDTKALTRYIKALDFYKEFKTYTQDSKAQEETESEEGSVGRPSLTDSEVENDATAASKQDGTNTADNRERMSMSSICPICGGQKEEGQLVCEECSHQIEESDGYEYEAKGKNE